jgi:rabenosyn-5
MIIGVSVCCFGYCESIANFALGYERNHTDHFLKMRRETVDRIHLETSRLEKRLTKLTQLLTDPTQSNGSEGLGGLWGLVGSGKSQQKTLEQSVIAWEDDATVPNCPFCQQEFSNYSFRRHHCRLCGRVVCGDPQTECSSLVGLNVAAEKGRFPIGLDVRMCKDCRHTLFSKADFEREIQLKPPDQRSYENLVQFERGIRLLLPKFHKLLVVLQDPEHPPSQLQINDATKVRKRLTDSFIQYETAARRIRDFTTSSPTQHRLQKAVYQQASNFLHINMLPLKALPKILKHASPHGASKARLNGSTGGGALASIRYNDRLGVETSSNPSSSAMESLEAEEKDLRERLIVLEEQKFIVTEMLNDARKKRRFEEMTALSTNVDDLSREIDSLRARVVKVEGDFEGLYAETDAIIDK